MNKIIIYKVGQQGAGNKKPKASSDLTMYNKGLRQKSNEEKLPILIKSQNKNTNSVDNVKITKSAQINLKKNPSKKI